MAAPERYDALVVGSGQGGKLLAWDLARSGRRTAVVERRWIGGSCPNINCMPSKNEIWSAHVAYVARHGAEFGTTSDRVAVDMVKVRQRKRDMVDRQVDAHLRAYKERGAELIMGTGRFFAPKTLEGRLHIGVERVPLPHTGISYWRADVELVALGYVRVNDQLETTAPDVWAIGECAGTPHFTHASVDDFRIIKDNLAGGNRNTRDRLIPYCVFTDPPLAHVGLSERDAHRQSVATRLAKLPMSDVLRVQAVDARPGLMKVLVSASDDHILGFTMIGPEAGEVMAVVQAAMLAELPYPKLRDAVLAHLTMAEGLGALLSDVPAMTHRSTSR